MINNAFGDFIETNYDVLYQSGVSEPSEAEWIFLGENHENMGVRKINSLFLQKFTNESDLILLEGTPSHQKIKHASQVTLNSKNKNFNVVGWDMDAGDFENYGRTVSEAQREETAKTQRITLKLLESDLKEEEKSKLEDELVKLSIKQVKDCIQQMGKQSLNPFKYAALTFEKRTQSLIKSCNIASDQFTRKFLVAGEGHFKETSSINEIGNMANHFREDAESALKIGNECYKKFKEFIKDKRAVILSPKNEVTAPFQQRGVELRNRIMPRIMAALQIS